MYGSGEHGYTVYFVESKSTALLNVDQISSLDKSKPGNNTSFREHTNFMHLYLLWGRAKPCFLNFFVEVSSFCCLYSIRIRPTVRRKTCHEIESSSKNSHFSLLSW